MTLLGKQTILWRIGLLFTWVLWQFYKNTSERTWDKIKYGSIPHKHEYDHDNPKQGRYWKYYSCKHYGCNLISIKESK